LHVVSLHEAHELGWDFGQDLLCEVTSSDGLLKLDKLHDVALDLSALAVAEGAWTIAIKFSHCREVGLAYTDNDD